MSEPVRRYEGATGTDTSLFGTFAPSRSQRMLIALGRNTPLRRGLFRKALTRMILALRGTPVDIMFRGCGFRLFGENNLIEYGLLLSPDYNKADLDFLIDGAPSDATYIDIGANIGLYSLPLAKSAPNGRVIAIDANPQMIERLLFNAQASGVANLTAFGCAVSDASGMAGLNIRKNDVAIVSIEERTDGAIHVRTLASILEQAGVTAIHGLKIDIEGHEDKALVPFLDKAPAALLPQRIVIEHIRNVDYPGCAAAFKRLGYKIAGRTRNNSFHTI